LNHIWIIAKLGIIEMIFPRVEAEEEEVIGEEEEEVEKKIISA
jgi:hypothetical protein